MIQYISVFRYNSSTGQFTVPRGGTGLYFLYTNFFAENDRFADFAVRVNEGQVCYAKADMDNTDAADNGTPSCGVATLLSEGKAITSNCHKTGVNGM